MHILEEWRICDIEEKAKDAVRRSYALRSDVDRMECTIRELRTEVDRLRSTVQTCVETIGCLKRKVEELTGGTNG